MAGRHVSANLCMRLNRIPCSNRHGPTHDSHVSEIPCAVGATTGLMSLCLKYCWQNAQFSTWTAKDDLSFKFMGRLFGLHNTGRINNLFKLLP